MSIRKSIMLSYMILVVIVLLYSAMLVVFSAMQKKIDGYVENLSYTKDVWNELLNSMNELQINWADGRTFVKFRGKSEHLDSLLYELATSNTFQVNILHYNSKNREKALYNTWAMARGSIFKIIQLIQNTNFQRIVKRLDKQPGLQRLNHLWNDLFYSPSNKNKKDAYIIRQVLDVIEFFPIYSETMNHLFNITIHETDLVKYKLDKMQSEISLLFFIVFLVLYMIFALRFSGRISKPIITLSLRLSSFMGKTLKLESYSQSNEMKLLTHAVEDLIEHYTYLALLAKRLAVGNLNSSLMNLPEQGVVGNALKEVDGYLKELTETSQLIRDGNYGAEVTVKSQEDSLAINFNIMSKVIFEKITTLRNMFEAVDESILVVNEKGDFLEANANLFLLLSINTTYMKLSDIGRLTDFIESKKAIEQIYDADAIEEIYTQLINLEGRTFPVKIISKYMPVHDGQSKKVMLFITNESVKVRAEREKEKLRSQAVEAELRALRAQINPHFLFNTLNGIANLVESKSKEAVSMIEKLAELFRYSLASTRRRTVQVVEELDVIKQYLDIEKMRFGNSLMVEYIIDDSLVYNKIPPMLIQPLVENAVKYGVDDRGEIHLQLTVEKGTSSILISVSDHGSQVIDLQILFKEEGTGIKNVNRRLQSLYNRQLRFIQIEPQGLKVVIEIPEE